MQGNKQRANARLGLVSPPAGKSKLIWIRAGASRDSVLLAAGLMAAIRHKRLDVRLVLTYEEEYRDIIVEQLSGLEKIGFGYACANTVATESRMLKRLNPFAIIFAGNPANESIVRALEKQPVAHLLNFQTNDVEGLQSEVSYSNTASKPGDERSFEAMTLLMQSQVDTQLGALLKGSKDRHLFLLSGVADVQVLTTILNTWKKSILSESSILCINAVDNAEAITLVVQQQGLSVKCFSQWDRQTAAEKEVFIIDEWRWFAATAASALAIHLFKPDQTTFWQSLASATALSLDEKTHSPVELNLPHKNAAELISYWESLSQNTFQCRKLGDENRRLFWEYRRDAQEKMDELLQKVFDW